MSRAAKKTKTSVVWPTIDGVPTMEGLDKPLVQTLATVCAKLYDPALYAAWTPADGKPIDDKLAQPYELSKEGGQYSPKGGTYHTGKDGKAAYTNGTGDVIKGSDVFNHLTKAGEYESLAQYGTVIDGITDFHRESQAFFPPFAALIVQPKDKKEVRARSSRSPPRPHPSSLLASSTVPRLPAERECCTPPAGPYPHPRLARIYHVVRLGQRHGVLALSL